METNRANFRRNTADIKKTSEQNDQFAQTESDSGKKSIVNLQPHTPVVIGVEKDLSTTNSKNEQNTALEGVINDDGAHEISKGSTVEKSARPKRVKVKPLYLQDYVMK